VQPDALGENATGMARLAIQFDAKTKEGERIYCLDGEFELKCPEKERKLELELK
jgi:hypothetical protein